LRRKGKVFFAKHFFRNRFDYREEWKRLSHTLYDPDAEGTLAERGIEALARIYESKSGLLLFQREGHNSPLDAVAVWKRELPDDVSEDPDGSLYRFLKSTSWVVDTWQYRQDPGFYRNLELPAWLLDCDKQQILVPLLEEKYLTGIIVLTQESPISLTYEDTDLLKIVGRQVAGVLAQQQASERLAEGRQFEAYSRLTAFLMHDLKNVAAQQALVVKNAEKYKDNPEFVNDAFETIDHSVKRINRLIAQLAQRNKKERRARVPMAKALAEVVESVSDRSPVPVADLDGCDAFVSADPERLAAVFTHVLRNAQDATPETGTITVALDCTDSLVNVAVSDTGVGMEESFVRKTLFRPFESTKGVDGMGIGAYQAREYVRDLGGFLDVESAPGQGTTVRVRLPLAAKTTDGEGRDAQ
jgi:putative PEP-CTERM system histidine kinase